MRLGIGSAIAGALAVTWLSGCPATPQSLSGALDTSFSYPAGYAVFTSGDAQSTRGVEAAVMPDGRIVVAGRWTGSGGEDVLVARYTTGGGLDPTFGAAGFVTYGATGNGNDRALGLALQPDGKILVAGYAVVAGSTKRDLLVLRLTGAGELDTTFGAGGVFTYDGTGNGTDIAFAVTLQADGKILVAGESASAVSQDAVILRLLASGSLDATFADQGVYRFDGPSRGLDRLFDVKVQPDGKIVGAGTSTTPGGVSGLLLRVDSTGILDASFGTGGTVVFRGPAGQDAYANSLCIQSNGSLVVAGAVGQAGSFDLLASRFLASGQPDSTFGIAGTFVYANPLGGDDYGYAAVLQPSGGILVGGSGTGPFGSQGIVVGVTSGGALDVGFGAAGLSYLGLGDGSSTVAYGLAPVPGGKVMVTGSTSVSGAERLFLARLIP